MSNSYIQASNERSYSNDALLSAYHDVSLVGQGRTMVGTDKCAVIVILSIFLGRAKARHIIKEN